jgi:hypothetical protein
LFVGFGWEVLWYHFGVEARGLTVLELSTEDTENTETLAAIALIAEDTGNTRHVRFSGTAKFPG